MRDVFLTVLFQVVVLVACALWLDAKAAHALQPDGFRAAAARLLRRVRLPAARLLHVPRVERDVERILQGHWPGCRVILFGSTLMGVALDQSDVDLVLLLPAGTELPRAEVLSRTGDTMLEHPQLFHGIRRVPQASVPIVSALHVPTGFNVDICYDSHNGIVNTNLLRYLLSLDERALQLTIIVKYWARLHGITGRRRLPSYAMYLMVIFYLQQREILPAIVQLQRNVEINLVAGWNMEFSHEKYGTRNNESLCTLLGGFFKYYTEFDFNKYVISPYLGRPLEVALFEHVQVVPEEYVNYKRNVAWNVRRPLSMRQVWIQDPFNHGRNLARHVDIHRNSSFVTQFQYATMKFRQKCDGFLETILAA